MRIYIIGNDGITLCREPPPTIHKGEIGVASREELHVARLSGKRLLALSNALPGIEKQTRVGDRNADRSAVVGDRTPARSGPTVRHEAPVKAGRGGGVRILRGKQRRGST